MKLIKKILVVCMCLCLMFSSTLSSAHSGRSHSGGSHHDNDSGIQHYYCNGHPAHLHENGVCPYSTSGRSSSSSTKGSSKYYNTSTIKKVQKKLNNLGYKCGKADGHCGSKTKTAIKKYQKKKRMTVNGKITKTLLKKLNIS